MGITDTHFIFKMIAGVSDFTQQATAEGRKPTELMWDQDTRLTTNVKDPIKWML